MTAGFRIEAEGDEVVVLVLKTRKLVAQGRLHNGLIYMELSTEKGNFSINQVEATRCEMAMLKTNPNPILKWHERMSHASFKYLEILSKNSNGMEKIKFCNEKVFCPVCLESKMCRDPYLKERERASCKLELLHGDLLEITPKADDVFPKTWILSIVDDFSRYTVSFVMNKKSETADCFKHFVKEATMMHNLPVSRFRCDRGGEFILGQLQSFCEMNGICTQYAETNIHQHNGVPENFNKLLMNVTRALMHQSRVPRCWFPSAVINANYLINRSACSSINYKTQFEMWRGSTPDLSAIQMYGCLAYALDEK